MNYMRKDFISNVSHEVKTPVATIVALSELLLENNLSQSEQTEYLSVVNQEAMRLSRLRLNIAIDVRRGVGVGRVIPSFSSGNLVMYYV